MERTSRRYSQLRKKASELNNGQPTAIVYRTIKGWQYGIEGRASHGAGHKLCTDGYFKTLGPLIGDRISEIPRCENEKRCSDDSTVGEACFWEALKAIRMALENNPDTCAYLAKKISESRSRLAKLSRKPRANAPDMEAVYRTAKEEGLKVPSKLAIQSGSSTTLRGELGKALGYLNKKSGGAILVAAADLLGSTSFNEVGKEFPAGFFNAISNAGARTLSVGGICEDAMAGVLSGLSTFGHNIGAGSSYGAFITPLGHIAARLHCIGSQSRQEIKRTLQDFHTRMRTRRIKNRRGWTYARRSAGTSTPAGKLPARDDDNHDAMGSPGSVATALHRPCKKAGGDSPVRDASERNGL